MTDSVFPPIGFETPPVMPHPDETTPMEEQTARAIADDLKPKAGKYYTRLAGLYGSIGIVTFMFDPHCGQGILESADDTARSVDRLARENPAIRRIVESVLAGSAWAEFFAAHAPIFKVVAEHHMPAGIMERFRSSFSSMSMAGVMPNLDGDQY